MALRRPHPMLVVPPLLLGLLLLWLAVPNLGPTVRAARGDGDPGTFTAVSLTCIGHPGHERCSWTGDFRSRDGGSEKAGVQLSGRSRDALHAGDRTPALDVGRPSRVYAPGGSREWIVPALMLVAGLLMVGWAASCTVLAGGVPRTHTTR